MSFEWTGKTTKTRSGELNVSVVVSIPGQELFVANVLCNPVRVQERSCTIKNNR